MTNVSETQIRAAVAKVLATNEWPIHQTYDDAGLSERDYGTFCARVFAALAAQQDVREARPHKVMTRKEYNGTTLKGWHSVCHNYDGGGNTGIRYHGDVVDEQ